MTDEEFQRFFYLIASTPQGKDLRRESMALLRIELGDLDFELAKAAFARVRQTDSRFLPASSEIRRVATELRLGPRRAGIDAWGDVVSAIRRVGSYGSPRFKDPIVADIVKSIGWMELCLGDNESALRARFVDAYDQHSARVAREAQVSAELRLPPPALAGLELPRALVAARAEIASGAEPPQLIARQRLELPAAPLPAMRPAVSPEDLETKRRADQQRLVEMQERWAREDEQRERTGT